jgi:MinD-like ATPase involved in chromosome partitioning or flagellar assembly
MTIDPEQIRAEIESLVAQLPDSTDPESMANASLAELEEIARRLSEAHDVLMQALESAEKG